MSIIEAIMLSPNSSSKPRILGAIAEDIVSELLSRSSPIPVPLTTLRTVIDAFTPKWLRANYYLNWDDIPFLAQFYSKIWNNTLRFRFDNTSYHVPHVVVFDNTTAKVLPGNILLRPSASAYVLSKQIEGITQEHFRYYLRFLRFHGRSYKNGLLLRLAKITQSSDKLIIDVQPTYYETVCRTNLCLDARGANQTKTLRQLVHNQGRLEPLSKSPLANPIGVNCILFTADGQLIMPLRSKQVVVRPNQLSPSFSGDFEAMDVRPEMGSLNSIHVIREGFEELGLMREHLSDDTIHFLGLARELVRGGKPDMFFEAHTNLTKEEILRLHKSATDKWEFKTKGWVFWPFGEFSQTPNVLLTGHYEFRRQFEKLLEQEGYRISIPLLTNIILWVKKKLGSEPF